MNDLLLEIQDAPGEIFDLEGHIDAHWEEIAEDWNHDEWPMDDDADLEAFSLECCFGPEE